MREEGNLPPFHRFDPWAPGRPRDTLRFLLASTVAHVFLLVVLATVTIQVVRRVERIRVNVEASPFGWEDFDGLPALNDLAGALRVSRAPAQKARPAIPRMANVRAPVLPRLGAIGAKLGAGKQVEGRLPLAFGAGAIQGIGGEFGDYIGGLRRVGLDVALVIDTTESMQFAIDEVKANLTAFVSVLQRMVPTTRVGIVVFRDQGDDYVVRWTDLSFRTDKLKEFMKHIRAAGGGDWEEAVFDALDAAIHDLSWRRKSKKMVVLVGGSPPHSWEMKAVGDAVRAFRARGGYVSTVDVTRRLHEEYDRFMWRSIHGREPYRPSPLPEYYKETVATFARIARQGGGEMISLDESKKLVREVLILAFGDRWKVELAKYVKELS